MICDFHELLTRLVGVCGVKAVPKLSKISNGYLTTIMFELRNLYS